MPHATTSPVSLDPPSKPFFASDKMGSEADSNGLEKFPDLDLHEAANNARDSTGRALNGTPNGFVFPPRKDLGSPWRSATGDLAASHAYGHVRQKSLGEALRSIRTRSGSTTQNVHEIADALRAPISPTLVILCVMWYSSSALTNTSSKSILNAFDKPATLTFVQFAFVSGYCMLLAWLANVFPYLKRAVPSLRYGIRYPSADVIRTTLPLAAFQIGGHLLSSTATSKIPVSLVHTIKGLSPLFTVFAYRLFFDIRYPTATYLSLVPLTLGVMLACSGSHSFNGGQFFGILYALLATIIFVTQNIFSKRLFNEASRAEAEGQSAKSRKLDKLNLLCYSSGLAFLATGPIWLWSDGLEILGDFLHDGSVDLSEGPNSFDHGRLLVEFIFNGTFHFAQNMLAFVLLSRVSPVTYSVASLIKRVFVIAIAIFWFRSPTTKVQAAGIALTFLGLYCYDRTKESKADRRARTMTEIKAESLLPLNTAQLMNSSPLYESPTPLSATSAVAPHPYTVAYGLPTGDDPKKCDDGGRGRARGNSTANWMPPGTRQEDTWRPNDKPQVQVN